MVYYTTNIKYAPANAPDLIIILLIWNSTNKPTDFSLNNLTKQLKFRFDWRDYQQNFLNGFKEHITDNHLHVVAPPGSGKTILGLEMMIRIGRPSLVLAPTLTIRNQWKSRMKSFFDDQGRYHNFSMDIKNPKELTFSTYQSLFSLHKSFGINDNEALLDFIVKNNIETLVLDEAHHLKNGWWKSLFALKATPNLTIIALTATPPYDSSANELERYFSLCGPIDDEIAVPDLIKNGDLCPHQDYVYFSKPEQAEIKYIVAYRAQIIAFTNRLLSNQGFVNFLKKLPIYSNANGSLELVYENTSFFSSILIFLKAAGQTIEKEKLKILGFKDGKANFPSFTYEWAETLLQYLLIDEREHFSKSEELLLPIEKELRQIGVLEKRKVDFVGDRSLYRNLASSPSKFEGIQAILTATFEHLNSRTKAVVLTDFIRKEYLSFSGKDTKKLRKIGVVSIFQYVLAHTDLGQYTAVLTGTLIILHKTVIEDLKRILDLKSLGTASVVSSKSHFHITVGSTVKNKMVAAITKLFEQGEIKILIGTKSLLGEGWDAPSINSLILASYVGSFVSSNQMRGRAIRIDPNDSNKIGNIWHLVCIDPTVKDGGKDLAVLKQRFLAFTGVSLKGIPVIENGLGRLNLPEEWDDEADLNTINTEMIHLATKDTSVKTRWETAIQNGNVLVQELRMPYNRDKNFTETNRLNALNVAKYLLFQVAVGLSLFLPEVILKNLDILLGKGWLTFVYILLAGILLGFAPATFKALKVYFRFGNQFKRTKKIAHALYQYLKEAKLLTSTTNEMAVLAYQEKNGRFSIHLNGANQHDGNLFVKLLEEIIAPIENPRYLLRVRSGLKQFLGYKTYYAVPLVLGRKKESAQAFLKSWKSHIGGTKLVYTRTLEGRRLLLKARFSHVRYQFEERPEKATSWK